MTVTHCIDARELLRQLQDDGDDDGLAVIARAEEFQHGDLLLLGHPHRFLPHLLNVIAHVFAATQTHQSCKKETRKKKKG